MFPAWGGNPQLNFRTFNTEDGLAQVVVLSLAQDPDGFLWVGTQSGLSRFDGHRFLNFTNNPEEPGSISSNEILSLLVDRNGTLWVGTQSGGLNLYDPDTRSFQVFRHIPDDPHSLSLDAVQNIVEDKAGRLWLSTWGGGLNRFDRERGSFVRFQHDDADPNSLTHNRIWAMAADAEGILWLATEDGLDRFNPQTETFSHFRHDADNKNSLSQNLLDCVLPGRDGAIWVGSFSEGLNRLDTKTGHVERFSHNPKNTDSLSNNGVHSLLQDKDGKLWVGTEGGLNLMEPTGRFLHFSPGNSRDLPAEFIRTMFQDRLGNLWIGTASGLSVSHPRQFDFGLFRREPEPGKPEAINSMAVEGNRYLWIGSDGGLFRFDRETNTFEPRLHDTGDLEASSEVDNITLDGTSGMWLTTERDLRYFNLKTGEMRDYPEFRDYTITRILPQENGRVWIATFTGLFDLNPQDGSFVRMVHDDNDPTSLSHDAVVSLLVDRGDRIWAGTYGSGLNLMKPDRSGFRRFIHDPDDSQSIGSNVVDCLQQGEGDDLWVGTRVGLYKMNTRTEKFQAYRAAHGLPNEFINGILLDKTGGVWVSTDKGIACLDPQTQTFDCFNLDDGLLTTAYSSGVFAQFPNGDMAFGSEGFNLFNPNQIEQRNPVAPIVITDLFLFNEPVATRHMDPDSPLEKPLDQAEMLTLSYRDYVVAFNFTALDFAPAANNHYVYKLEGCDTDWISASSKSRMANYTNLPGGTYTFCIKGSNRAGLAHGEARLRVRIEPPPWKTPWAYILYVCVIVGVIYYYVTAQKRKLARERLVNQRLSEVDRLKDEFLANTSHELRTPLHGMVGLAESLLDGVGGPLEQTARNNLAMIIASGQRLANLVNDILDFSKLKDQSLECRLTEVDVFSLAQIVVAITQPLLGGKELELFNQVSPNTPRILADEDRLQQVLFNLVGNAVKFTEKGTITISAHVEKGMLRISVSDTGIGIPHDQFDKIFQSFQQADGSTAREYGGTGLGLAVSNQLVELMGGHIHLISEPGEGSIFSFSLVLADAEAGALDEIAEVPVLANPSRTADSVEPVRERPNPVSPMTQSNQNFRILVVDDDAVNRQVLNNHLALQSYNITEAHSGQEAVEAVENGPFDLILLDVMMPKMTGYDVCRILRERFPAHELPVIYLTARSLVTDVVTGFETGANDFLSKPVAKDELLSRVKTHLALLDNHRNLERKVAERTQHLIKAQRELLKAAHTSGMAEIAADVVHSAGNQVNSLAISIQLIRNMVDNRKSVGFLEKINGLLADNADNLASFISEDPRGVRLPEAVSRLLEKLTREYDDLEKESTKLIDHLEGLNLVLLEQQNFAIPGKVAETADLNELVVEALQQSAMTLQDSRATVSTELARDIPLILVNKERLLRVLLCLLLNVGEAMDGVEGEHVGRVLLKTTVEKDWVYLEIDDNGVGIESGNLAHIFEHGFTTKEDGRGFGLHYCGNALKEMHATIDITSEGPNKGSQVLLGFSIGDQG